MVLSRAIYAVLGLILAFVLFMIYIEGMENWRWGIIPIVFLAVMNYVFQPQIDYWWFEKTQPTLNIPEHRFLVTHFSFYRSLAVGTQEEFGRDCIRFNHDIEYILKGVPSFPDDLKIIVAAYAISLKYAFGLNEKNPFEQFERIAFYPHPFMSPEIEEVHACETYFNDGVWIFSLEQFIPGVTKPTKFFNITLYEMAKVLLKEEPELNDKLNSYSTEELEEFRTRFSSISLDRIKQWINLDKIDPKANYIATLIVFWDKVSALPKNEREELPLGGELHHLDVIKGVV